MRGIFFKVITATTAILFSCGFLCKADYCYPKGNTSWTNSSRIGNFVLNGSDGSRTVVLDIQYIGAQPIYKDKTGYVYNVKGGSTVNFSAYWEGSGEHGYMYIDYSGDETFTPVVNPDGTVANNSELCSYTYYNGKNSLGETVGISDASTLPPNLPAFRIRTDVPSGRYRARMIVDYNSINPCGSPEIGQRQRCICDFVINITQERQDYCRFSGNSTNPNGRRLESLSLAGTNGASISITGIQPTSTGPVYIDKTDIIYNAKAGMTVTPTLDWKGGWMHAYMYIDYSGEGTFTPLINANGTVAPNSELCSYTYSDGKNSKGETVNISTTNNLAEPFNLAPFVIKTDLPDGTYRARLKIDWNNTDPCGASSIGGNGGCICDFTIKIANNLRQITVATSSPIAGNAFIDGHSSSSITSEKNEKIIAAPTRGYKFVNWTQSGTIISTDKVYTDNIKNDHTIIANFAKQDYPAMTRMYTGNLNQQNRYLKTVSTTGTYTPTVFSAATEAELPYTAYSATIGSYTSSGALIDKTDKPIVVKTGTESFSINFKAWTNIINGYNSELKWTQQSVFIDWNGDGTFSGSSEIYAKSGSQTSNDVFASADGYTRTINIPANTGTGMYRMRVVYNEPATYTEEWQNTFFTTNAGKLRNGIAYDFTINVADNPNKSENIVLSTSANPVWYLLKSAPATQKTGGAWIANKFVEADGNAAKVYSSLAAETPSPSFDDKFLWRFEGSTADMKIVCKTGVEIQKPQSGANPENIVLGSANSAKFNLSASVSDKDGTASYYFTSKDASSSPRLQLAQNNGALQYYNSGNSNNITASSDGCALFNLIQKEEVVWNMIVYTAGSGEKSYCTNYIDSIKTADRSIEIFIKGEGLSNIIINDVDSMVFRYAQPPKDPAFSNITQGEIVSTGKTVTINPGSGIATTYWSVNETGIPSNFYTGPIDISTWKDGEKTIRAVTMKDGVISNIKAVSFTLDLVKPPKEPTFGNITQGETVTAGKSITINSESGGTTYWSVNTTGTPSTLYTGPIDISKWVNGEKTMRAVTEKDGLTSTVKILSFTLNIASPPAMPNITYTGTSTQTPYCRGYINMSATGSNVTISYKIDGGGWNTYTSRINIKGLSSGSHTIYAKVTDNTTGLTSATKEESVTYNGNNPTNPAKWLDHISDHVTITQLTIPGTHETCATGGTAWHQCQNSSVTAQLNQGIRVMDLRIGNGMNMYHGSTSMGSNLSGVLNEVKNFLNSNPSEFVILSVKDENWSGDQDSWTNQVASLMDATGKAYVPGSSYNYTVGELRGKFIIIRRYGYFYGRGIDVIDWPDDWYTNSGPYGNPPLMIQDAYNYGAELASSASGRKWGYAQKFMDYAKSTPNDGELYINFMTATSISTPGDWANKMVPKLNSYLGSNPKGRYGFIMLDYVGTHTGAVTNLINANKYPEL